MEVYKCRHNNCAVCDNANKRKIFEFIFQRKNVDLYLCKNAAYAIKGDREEQFILCNLDNITKGARGYYVIDPYTGNPIYLNKDNIEIVCSKNEAECCAVEEPYVRIWKSSKAGA